MTIKKYDIANGPGVRVSVFAAGCHHACKGCFNFEAWDFNAGEKFEEKEIKEVIEALNYSYIDGLSLLGGEPLELVNAKGFLSLVKKVKENYPNKTVWMYTGYLFDKEVINNLSNKSTNISELISLVDVVVDGRFDIDLVSSKLAFKGSSNQRIIDVKKTLEKGEIVLHPLNDVKIGGSELEQILLNNKINKDIITV
ncbi:MAG: anaerobic ribonucleoside-triphosphate reductase activating protein [Bacilli bacterium]